MSSIITQQRRVWTRQPTQHEIRSGELIVSPFSKQWNKSGTLSFNATALGAAFAAGTSSGAALAGPQRKLLASDFGKNTYIAVIHMAGSISTAQAFAGSGASSQYAEEFRIGNVATNNVWLKFRDTAQNALEVSYVTDQPRLIADRVNVIAWRVHSSTYVETWLNGVQLQATPTTNGFNETAHGVIPGSNYAVNNFWYNGAVTQSTVNNLKLLMFARIFGRPIDLRNASLSPWQIFARRDRYAFITVSAGGLSISASVGQADASAFQANVNLQRTIAASIATAAAAGFTATVNLQRNIAATRGDASAFGNLANVDLRRAIAAALGSAAASGYDASISLAGALNIPASLGVAEASGKQALVNLVYSLNASTGITSAIGFDASLSNDEAPFTQAQLDYLLAYMQENLMIPTAEQITAAVVAALQATTIPVDAVKMNGAEIIGDGSETNRWRGVGVQP